MNWPIAIIQLILQYGPEAAQQIVKLIKDIKAPGDVTSEMWDSLIKLCSKSYDDYINNPK